MTPQAAQQMAQNYLKEISKFEREFTLTIEGDAGYSVRKQAIVRGTNTSFDTKYYLRNNTSRME